MKPDKTLEQTLSRRLNEKMNAIDGASLARLAQARAGAVEKAERKTGIRGLLQGTRLIPAGGLAAMIGIAVGLSFWHQQHSPTHEIAALSETPAIVVEMAAADLDIELLEDIEFYDWLTLAEHNGDSG